MDEPRNARNTRILPSLRRAAEDAEFADPILGRAVEYAEYKVYGCRFIIESLTAGVILREFAYTCRLSDGFDPKFRSNPTSMFDALR